MKKLLVLVLILAMAPLASAVTISLQGEGSDIVATAGDIVTINVVNVDGMLVSLDAIISVAGGDVISGAMSTTDAASFGWDAGTSYDPIGLGTSVVGIGGGNLMGNDDAIVGYVKVTYTGGIQVVSIAVGDNFGGSFDAMTGPLGAENFSTGTVTIIPEPMTIALLGLGGLFLRRRRS